MLLNEAVIALDNNELCIIVEHRKCFIFALKHHHSLTVDIGYFAGLVARNLNMNVPKLKDQLKPMQGQVFLFCF